jgi:S1-C subfamily serine protease
MGNSDDLMIGETIIAIGNPFGFSNTVTTGVISAIKRSIRTEDAVFHDFIQTDASINPGNSGGPLLNINGELIGINTAIYAKAQGIGFAIPINKAKRVISDLIRYGEVIPAWIGIMVQDIDARMARYLRLKSSDGVLITKVDRPSPARKAGIQDGDVLISIDGRKIHSTKGYQTAMKNFAAGETLKLKIQRKGRGKTVSVAAEVFPLELAMDLAYELLGITVENLSFKKRFGHKTTAEEGVIISKINPQSYLGRIGVAPGDVIRQIDEMTIKDVKDFKKAVVKYRQKPSVVVLLQRRDDLYNITVRL